MSEPTLPTPERVAEHKALLERNRQVIAALSPQYPWGNRRTGLREALFGPPACETCNGSGWFQFTGPGGGEGTCPDCHGSGK